VFSSRYAGESIEVVAGKDDGLPATAGGIVRVVVQNFGRFLAVHDIGRNINADISTATESR
jgi:hypothetical protein